MEIDEGKVDETVRALSYLSIFKDKPCCKALERDN
jgi:hypothetical protein